LALALRTALFRVIGCRFIGRTVRVHEIPFSRRANKRAMRIWLLPYVAQPILGHF
jgi:hypothetical protein